MWFVVVFLYLVGCVFCVHFDFNAKNELKDDENTERKNSDNLFLGKNYPNSGRRENVFCISFLSVC